ncbi:MAG: PAS domain S-box protein [bacterium]
MQGSDFTSIDKQELASLRQSEQMFRIITEQSAMALFIFQHGKIIYSNEALTGVLDYSLDEVYAWTEEDIYNLVHPEDREFIKEQARKKLAWEPDAVTSYTYRLYTKQGHLRWMSQHSRPIMYKGEPALLVSLAGITERKKAEEELRESRSRLSAAIESLPFDFFMIGEDGRYIMANSTARRHWGGVSSAGEGPEDLAGKTPDELGVDKKYLDIWKENNRRAFAGEVVKGEVTYEAEGEERHFFNIISPVYYGDEIKEILGVNIDVTDRKRAEDSLAEEKERLSVTLRSIGDGVISTDREGRIVLMNRMAENLTGRRQEDALGEDLANVLHIIDENSRERAQDPVQKVLETQGSITLAEQTLLVDSHGFEKVIADSAAPIRDRESRIIGVVIVFRDVTEKRKLEAEMIRTEKLESVGILAGGIAHDFNNILTAILANVSMSRLSVRDDPKVDQRLEEAEKACERAKSLTRQLLTFTKGGTPVKEAMSLRQMLRETSLFALRGSNVDCEFEFPENLWPVEADQGQISQVIHNLVINADQAMPEGGTVHVKAENLMLKEHTSLPPGAYALIKIKDNGVGIPPDYQEKIFDPFFTTKEKGSGLGLATSFSIIRQHDGHIEVSSEPGQGTTFTLYLPATPGKELRESSTREEPVPGKGRVLVMDDDPAIRDLLSIMLADLGYEAEFASDGGRAITAYKKAMETGQGFDLVILDLTVPGKMGGKETMEALQKIDPEVRGIVSSGYSTDPIMADYKNHGFQGVVTKPYDMKELSKALSKLAK